MVVNNYQSILTAKGTKPNPTLGILNYRIIRTVELDTWVFIVFE